MNNKVLNPNPSNKMIFNFFLKKKKIKIAILEVHMTYRVHRWSGGPCPRITLHGTHRGVRLHVSPSCALVGGALLFGDMDFTSYGNVMSAVGKSPCCGPKAQNVDAAPNPILNSKWLEPCRVGSGRGPQPGLVQARRMHWSCSWIMNLWLLTMVTFRKKS